MKRFTDPNGVSTGWLPDTPTTKQLERLNVDQLLILARRKQGIKKVLLNFLEGKKI